ncbi:MAG: glutamine amidotransferase [Rhizobiaceae bacterium]
MSRPPERLPVLMVLHQETSSCGRVGQLLRAAGFPLDIVRPPLGERLPSSLRDHSGVVVFGGPMSVNDHDEYMRDEIDWLKVPLREDKPYLGICLGAQMLVKHLGGRVESHGDGLVEIGWYPIRATPAGRALMHWPSMVYQFHREGFSLPRGAELLATADTYPNQAFRYGRNAWAIQFHGELTLAMMHRWVVKAAHRFSMPGAQEGRLHLEGRMLFDRTLVEWLTRFLDRVFAGDPGAR